jgi:peptidoglycan/LPS O-acetylase OafA/YrhL
MTHAPLPRNAAIDCLRGVAIAVVLVLHFSLAYGLKDSPLTLLPAPVLDALAHHGNYGVTAFFAISGFLITSNILHRWGSIDRIDLRTFYLLRVARIMPPLLPVLATIVVLGSAGLPFFANDEGAPGVPAPSFLLGAGSVLTFWHNVLMQSYGYFNYCLNIYWSLSVEEVFYMLMPPLCLLLRRQWLFAAVCLLAIAAGPPYRAAHADDEIYYMYGYLACFDAIAMGCLAALLAPRLSLTPLQGRILRWLGGLGMAAVYLRGFSGFQAPGFSLMGCAAALFLLGSTAPAGTATAARRGWGWLRWMGAHSYELYLYHIIVLALMRNLVPETQVGYVLRVPLLLLFVALSALLAAGVARWVSEPVGRALRRAAPASRGRKTPAAVPAIRND